MNEPDMSDTPPPLQRTGSPAPGDGTTAFVLSGGGSLGSVQVGMLLALYEQGIVPDLLVGTSVGAVNAAWIAGHPDRGGAEELARVWRSVRRADVFPSALLPGLLGFVGHRDHLVPPDRFRALLREHLTFERLEDAPIPVHVVTTDVLTGDEVLMSRGDVVDASAAIPGIFPPVRVGDRILVDGAVANNIPITHAVERGATTVYVLTSGYACALAAPPRGALGVALHAVSLLVQQRLSSEVARLERDVDLRVVPPLCPLSVTPLDFSHTDELIERARSTTRQWLARRGHGQTSSLVHPHADSRGRSFQS